jgi:hypothetical protein
LPGKGTKRTKKIIIWLNFTEEEEEEEEAGTSGLNISFKISKGA